MNKSTTADVPPVVRNSRGGGRLDNKSVILTGATGSIGTHAARHLLREGAMLVVNGRDSEKLKAFERELIGEGFAAERISMAAGDCADPEACRKIVATAMDRFGRLDVLINNAGGAGPKHPLRQIPFTKAEMRARGDDQTMFDSAMNLLAGPWNMVRAAVAHMTAGGAVVNVSTIFSRTHYFGRIPYVVPKSGLNALSKGLAIELGADRGIRVNTLFPGPIASERIETVFARMDELQGKTPGATGEEFRGLMIAAREEAGKLDFRYPAPADVASTMVWLASDESAALSGHHIEVTNGMQVPAQSRSKLLSWPDKRLEDLNGQAVLILGGADHEEALVFAERHLQSGAKVLLTFRTLQALGHARALIASRGRDHNQGHKIESIQLSQLDPLRRESVDRAMQLVEDQYGRLDGVIVLPREPNGEHGHSLRFASDQDVENFVRDEIVAPVAFASALARNLPRWQGKCDAPAITYVTNPSDRQGNLLNEVIRAAIEALIRIWRHEDETLAARGDIGWMVSPNQLVRFDSEDEDNLAYSADWAATLTNRVRRMDPINLWVPQNIRRHTGKSAMPASIQRVLPGLHKGKTAVITGGSLGIGLQLGRFLAIAGARVLLSARGEDKLRAAREQIVGELRGVGYANPADRVHILAGIDVGDNEALDKLFRHSLDLFGQVDFLINNAGISGVEEMVVDTGIEEWNRTMQANLISNYALIRKYAPHMKQRGTGSVLNVSSYFGGEKYVAVAYPNRADYAVSKAGQRVLAEILSRHLGPEIQINALAPGPVDGARLRGLGGAPGLYSRRGRLVLENKRLNQIHGAMLAALREGFTAEELMALADNELSRLPAAGSLPKSLAKLLAQVGESRDSGSSSRFLLNQDMAQKLMARMVLGAEFSQEQADDFLARFVDAPNPFMDRKSIERSAERIESGILNRLHLHKMPTDEQVGLSTVFHLADEIVSGETFHPSGGLKFDRSVTEGELLLPPGKENLAKLRGKRIVLIGDCMRRELAAIAKGFSEQAVASLRILVRGEEAFNELKHSIPLPKLDCEVRQIGDDIEGALDALRREEDGFDVVVSSPFARLPMNALAAERDGDWDRVLSDDQFAALVNDQITLHFRVARCAALAPLCQIVLLTPDTSLASSREEFALALFVKNALHAFTVTLAVEGERLPTVPAINQVQLTRRARTEEPASDSELEEEMERVVHAVLQCAVPAPSPAESRYLSKIFRGNAVTV